MNHRKLFVRFLFFCFGYMYGGYGKNFFMFKPSFLFNDPERRIVIDRLEKKSLFDITVFGGTTCQAQEWASYFMPIDKTCVHVSEDGSSNMHGTDVNAAFMDIITVPLKNKTAAQISALVSSMTYDAFVGFCPKRIEVGVGGVLRFYVAERSWFSLASSVVHLKNKLNVCENILNAGGTGPDSGFGYKTLCAFMRAGCPTWTYGKWCPWAQEKTGVPEVELALGHDVEHLYAGRTGGFAGLQIPTGNRVCQTYVFSPVVGKGKHFGFFGGVDGDYIVGAGHAFTIRIVPSGLVRYLIPHKEQRSFDLKGRPWSRYMWAWLNDNALGDPSVGTNVTAALERMVPLVNYSTLCVDVSPNWSADVNVGMQLQHEHTTFELGYHGYAREAEEICFCFANMQQGLGLQAFERYLRSWADDDHLPRTLSLNPVNARVFSASPNLIDYAYSDGTWSSAYIPITLDSLDLTSAQTPAAFAQTLYALFVHQFGSEHVPVTLRLGGSYTFVSDNSYPYCWKAWGALTFAF